VTKELGQKILNFDGLGFKITNLYFLALVPTMQNIFNAVADSAKKILSAVGHSSVYRNNLKQLLFSRLFKKKIN